MSNRFPFFSLDGGICYDSNRVQDPNFLPCDSEAETSFCCAGDGICLSNGLCKPVVDQSYTPYYTSECTDYAWNAPSTCPEICNNKTRQVELHDIQLLIDLEERTLTCHPVVVCHIGRTPFCEQHQLTLNRSLQRQWCSGLWSWQLLLLRTKWFNVLLHSIPAVYSRSWPSHSTNDHSVFSNERPIHHRSLSHSKLRCIIFSCIVHVINNLAHVGFTTSSSLTSSTATVVTPSPSAPPSNKNVAIGVGAGVGALAGLAFLGGLAYLLRRRSNSLPTDPDNREDSYVNMDGGHPIEMAAASARRVQELPGQGPVELLNLASP